MDATDRGDRQLTHQRDAECVAVTDVRNPQTGTSGAHQTQNIDFGLSPDPSDARQERLFMRQRGAGSRKIGNADFNFTFTTPPGSQKSKNKTPQSKTQRHTRSARPQEKTRSPESRQISNESAPREDTHQIFGPGDSAALPLMGSVPTKKRRLNPPTALDIEDIGDAAVRAQTTAPVDNKDISAEPRTGVPETNIVNTESSTILRSKLEVALSPAGGVRSNTGEKALYPNNEFQGLRDRRNKSPVAEPISQSIEVEVDHGPEDRGPGVWRLKQLKLHNNLDIEINGTQRESERGGVHSAESTSESSEQRKVVSAKRARKRKRRSTVFSKRKRTSASLREGHTRKSADSLVRVSPVVTSRATREHYVKHGNAATVHRTGDRREEPGKVKTAIVEEGRSRRKCQINENGQTLERIEAERVDYDADENDETYVPDPVSPEPTPAPKRRNSAPVRTRQDASKREVRPSYPITTHRIANAGMLPTISEEHTADASDDEAQLPTTLAVRTAPNGVDVLAQVCRETIVACLEKLEHGNERSKSRGELGKKRSQLEAFGTDLQNMLFDMSQAVEHRLNLEARWRKSKRELAALQSRWLETRKQRDQLAMESDAIRRCHWENEERWNQDQQISDTANRLGLELDRSESDDPENLEYSLTEAANMICNAGKSNGVLAKVKRFNKQLEQVAAILNKSQTP